MPNGGKDFWEFEWVEETFQDWALSITMWLTAPCVPLGALRSAWSLNVMYAYYVVTTWLHQSFWMGHPTSSVWFQLDQACPPRVLAMFRLGDFSKVMFSLWFPYLSAIFPRPSSLLPHFSVLPLVSSVFFLSRTSTYSVSWVPVFPSC